MNVKAFALHEHTALGIPISLRPAFQEYDLEKLDPDRDAFTIMERTLGAGDTRELRWLFRRYGAGRLCAFVERHGLRLLPSSRVKYWGLYFGLSIEFLNDRIWIH